MHEAGIADRILEAALAEAHERGGRLTGVEVEVGPDAPVSEEAVRFHWEHAVAESAGDPVALRIVAVSEAAAFRIVAIDIDGT
jgi:Zn finger protein HypA/HybF involved in hydrogenase expression